MYIPGNAKQLGASYPSEVDDPLLRSELASFVFFKEARDRASTKELRYSISEDV